MSLMKLYINSLNEIITSWIQQCIKIYHITFTKNGTLGECINVVNWNGRRNDDLVDTEKSFDTI